MWTLLIHQLIMIHSFRWKRSFDMTAAQNTAVGVADMRSQPKIEPDAVQQQPLPMVGSADLNSL